MNILKKYCFKIEGFSLSDMRKILDKSHGNYELVEKGSMIFIKNKYSNKINNLRCINKYYTISQNGKPLKIPKTSGECFNCKRIFEIDRNCNCSECHRAMLERFESDRIFLIKK